MASIWPKDPKLESPRVDLRLRPAVGYWTMVMFWSKLWIYNFGLRRPESDMAHIFAAPNPKPQLDGSQGGVRYCLHRL